MQIVGAAFGLYVDGRAARHARLGIITICNHVNVLDGLYA